MEIPSLLLSTKAKLSSFWSGCLRVQWHFLQLRWSMSQQEQLRIQSIKATPPSNNHEASPQQFVL